jgi:hypothetical protein
MPGADLEAWQNKDAGSVEKIEPRAPAGSTLARSPYEHLSTAASCNTVKPSPYCALQSSCSRRHDYAESSSTSPDVDSAFNQGAERIRPVFKRLDGVERAPAGAWRVVGHTAAGAPPPTKARGYHSGSEVVEAQSRTATKRAASAPCQVGGAASSTSSKYVGSLEVPACLSDNANPSSRTEGRVGLKTVSGEFSNQQERDHQLPGGLTNSAGSGCIAAGCGRAVVSQGVSGVGGWMSRLKALLGPNA